MCEYVTYINLAMQQLSEQNDSFDMLQIRDRTREIAGNTVDVRFLPTKFEALAFYERGGIPGFVLTTKTIEMETDRPLIDSDGHHTTDSDSALVNETEKRSVFNFVSKASLIHEALAPVFDASKN